MKQKQKCVCDVICLELGTAVMLVNLVAYKPISGVHSTIALRTVRTGREVGGEGVYAFTLTHVHCV